MMLVELLRFSLGGNRLELWLAVLPPLAFHALTCAASWYLCQALPLRSSRDTSGRARLVIAHLSAALFASALFLAIANLWVEWLRDLGFGTELPQRGVGPTAVLAFFLFCLAVALHYLEIAASTSKEAEKRAFELRILAQDAELRALRAQLDPHFLFNSLNSISALTSSDPAGAREMCVLLASFLRQSLKAGALPSLALADELALVENYLAVERRRFGSRLRSRIEAGEEVAQLEVLPLILQPLVENAVRHGIAHRLEGGEIVIRAFRQDDWLHLSVTNDCDPERPRRRGTGIGLENVRKRLATRYEGAAALRVQEGDENFRVELTLPVGEGSS